MPTTHIGVSLHRFHVLFSHTLGILVECNVPVDLSVLRIVILEGGACSSRFSVPAFLGGQKKRAIFKLIPLTASRKINPNIYYFATNLCYLTFLSFHHSTGTTFPPLFSHFNKTKIKKAHTHAKRKK